MIENKSEKKIEDADSVEYENIRDSQKTKKLFRKNRFYFDREYALNYFKNDEKQKNLSQNKTISVTVEPYCNEEKRK